MKTLCLARILHEADTKVPSSPHLSRAGGKIRRNTICHLGARRLLASSFPAMTAFCRQIRAISTNVSTKCVSRKNSRARSSTLHAICGLALVFSYYCMAGELHDAIESQDYEALIQLCNQGAWLSEPDENGWTALHLAISQQDFLAASTLLNAGSSVNITTPDGYAPIHFAAIYNAHELMPLLVEYRADVNELSSNFNMETPLHLVASLEAWNQLIELGAEKIFDSHWKLPQEGQLEGFF